jgi:hypothetical protein
MQEAIRTIKKAGRGQVIIDIPDSFSGQDLEITISPLKRNPTKRTNSMRGHLKQYANVKLISKESTAWAGSVGDTHEND